MLTGLAHHNAEALGDGAGDHARAASCFLTGVHPKKTAGADLHVGVSVDQIVGRKLAGTTKFSTIELGCEDSRTVGNCDSGYSCAYTNSISWRTPSSPMPPEINPRAAFDRLFGADASLDPKERERRREDRSSILDLVSERTQSLMGDLGPSDRRKMDEYLYAVREIEKRIQMAEKQGPAPHPDMAAPDGIPDTFGEYVKLMYDLQVVAFQADLTRVSTLVVGREGSVRTYGEIGIPDPHHPLSHHRGNPEWIAKLQKINTFHVELFAYYLDKLKNTADGDGSLLDHSMVVYGSAISDGNQHSHKDLPVLLAGRRRRMAEAGAASGLPTDADDEPLPDVDGPHGRGTGVGRRQHGKTATSDRPQRLRRGRNAIRRSRNSRSAGSIAPETVASMGPRSIDRGNTPAM